MNVLLKLLIAFCVTAGMATGMSHKTNHGSHNECAAHHSSDDGGDSHDEDPGDPDAPPHHHDCCHFPSADRPLVGLSISCVFHSCLVEISTDRSLIPDEPVYALDKPPLI